MLNVYSYLQETTNVFRIPETGFSLPTKTITVLFAVALSVTLTRYFHE